MSIYYARILIDWVPFLVFVGLLLYFVRKMGKSAGDTKRYREDCLAEQRKLTAATERIAAALEQRRQGS